MAVNKTWIAISIVLIVVIASIAVMSYIYLRFKDSQPSSMNHIHSPVALMENESDSQYNNFTVTWIYDMPDNSLNNITLIIESPENHFERFSFSNVSLKYNITYIDVTGPGTFDVGDIIQFDITLFKQYFEFGLVHDIYFLNFYDTPDFSD